MLTPPKRITVLPPKSGGALAGRGITGIIINMVIDRRFLNGF
jgi:hypothetical protein